jgi:hypothetical protein
MAFLGVEPRSHAIALAEGLCDFGGITSAEGLRDGEAGHAPFQLCPGIRLTTEEKHEKPQSGQPSSQGTARCADLAVFGGTASTGLLDVRSLRFLR